MNTAELTVLLARIQVVSNQQVDEVTIQAWEPLVHDIEYDDAVDAVNEHFRTSERYLMPVHVVEGASRARRIRIARDTQADHAHEFNPASGYCSGCELRDDDPTLS